MPSLFSRTRLFVLLSGAAAVGAQSLTACPVPATYLQSTSGSQFQICPNSDIQAPSVNIVNSIASSTACMQLCSTTTGCSKAVYDHNNSICHIKGNPTGAPWVSSTQYDAIFLVQQQQTLPDGTAITACPAGQTTVANSDGSTSIICPNSDYQCPSVNIISGIPDRSTCATRCQQTTGCTKAVFDHINLLCHIKGNPTNVPWVVNLQQYDSLMVIRGQTTPIQSNAGSTTLRTSTTKPATTVSSTTPIPTVQGLTSCPANPTTFTTDDGSLYELCPKTDYQGSTASYTNGILSLWDCLQVCNTTPNCKRVVFDSAASICYVKGDNLAWVTSTQFDSVRFLSKTARTGSSSKGLGAWSGVFVMPVIPVAAYVVPQQPVSSRVLMFSSWGPDDFSGPTGITQFADFNFATGAVSARTITNTQHDMFCPGISALSDGRIIITGGENAEATSIYQPAVDNFVKGPPMQLPRGYQSSVTTSSGKVFTVGGSFSGGIGGKVGEVFDPIGNTWTLLPGADVTPILTTDAEGAWREDNHAWLFGWRNESVFQAGPSKTQHWYGTTGGGSVVAAGVRDPNNDAMCAVNIMYDALNGKIFSTGGSQSYTNSPAFTRSYITTIGAPFQPASVQQVANMINPRGFANGVVLPDGTILITGGQKTSLVFQDVDSILAPELYDPKSNTFKQLAPAVIPRNYHSVSLLLPDGTVFSGGGGMCPTAYNQTDAWCNRASDHPSAEIFSPPYLFNADGSAATRPVVSSVSSPSSSTGLIAKVGSTLTVIMSNTSGVTFSLVRMGSATHSINTDQRRVPLVNIVAAGTQYKIQLPNDSGVLIPGMYYLFSMSAAGVPSIARSIQISL